MELLMEDVKNKVPYTVILTHDIDVLSLKELPLFGKTFWGFIYRCLVVNFQRFVTGRLKLVEYLESVKYALFSPFIKLGLVTDPWKESLRVMLDIEKKYGVCSTLFFIPYPRRPGHTPDGVSAPSNRAAHYNLYAYKTLLLTLEREGWEVGIHGIDAYRNIESAREELSIFKELLPNKNNFGIRMHWLYHKGEETWKILDEVGYTYDATYGWNDKIGYPGNQYYPFIPECAKELLVLPLNIQDGALLSEQYQNLSNIEAWNEIQGVLEKARAKKAVVTVLWHNNSFVAPRYWGWLYEKIIQRAKNDGARIMRAIDLIDEFKRREKN
jgi:peptidoglycan/xylan/chitin deacetylase (PgdA/CDA1 family)